MPPIYLTSDLLSYKRKPNLFNPFLSAGWTPSVLNPGFWHDASLLSPGGFTTSLDLSGNNRDLTVATGTTSIVDAVANNKAIIRFSGSNALKFPRYQPSEWYLITNFAESGTRIIHTPEDDISLSFASGFLYSSSYDFNVLNGSRISANTTLSGGFNLINFNSTTAQLNGEDLSISTNEDTSILSTASYSFLGCRAWGNNSNWGQFATFDLCEILGFDTQLSLSNRQKLQNYLTGKWLP